MPAVDPVPFFFRKRTIRAIRKIAKKNSLTIYAGAGVTIDKSGLDWSALIDQLLSRHVADESARSAFIKDFGPLYAASAAHQYFRTQADDLDDGENEVRQRMMDVLGVTLYSAEGWRYGELVTGISEALMIWNLRKKSRPKAAFARLVTTNYDDFLLKGIQNAYARVGSSHSGMFLPKPKLMFPTVRDPLLGNDGGPSKWVTGAFPTNVTPCIHLHGRIPRSAFSANKSQTRFPVVSERDYHLTAEASAAALHKLFRESSVVIVGSSLTDPPLLRALEDTKSTAEQSQPQLKRWALLVSKRPGEDSRERADYEDMIVSRLQPLGVTPIFVDYYVQLAQFFRELATARVALPIKYAGKKSRTDYHSRLRDWWSQWLGEKSQDERWSLQDVDQMILDKTIRRTFMKLLDAPVDEELKVELWVRWNPAENRKMRLWASTNGLWTTEEVMREVDIGTGAGFAVVDAFRAGRADIRPADKRPGSPSKWQSYLSVPIWLIDPEESQKFVIGVIFVASNKALEDCCFGKHVSKRSLAQCLKYLKEVGGLLIGDLAPTPVASTKPHKPTPA